MTAAQEYRDLMGVPWLDGGRDHRRGLDCVGVMLVALHRAGFTVPDPQVAVGETDVSADIWKWFDRVEPAAAARHDVLRVWGRRRAREPLGHHVGVLDGTGRVLTATESGVALWDRRVFERLGLIGVYRPRVEPRHD